jgi:hypothetical protein
LFLLAQIIHGLDVGIAWARLSIMTLFLAAATSDLEFLHFLGRLIFFTLLVLVLFLLLLCVMFGNLATDGILARLTTAPPHLTTVIRLQQSVSA